MYNEAVIFLAGFLSIAYTEVCNPGMTRNAVGWLCVFLFAFMAFVNIVFMLREKIILLKNKICKHKKVQEEKKDADI